MKTTVLVLGIALLAAVPGPSSASDEWPRFRGPDGSGLAAGDARPPTNWSATSNLNWKAALPGPGSSSPIIWGERVFVTCYSGYGEGSSGAGPEKLQRHLVCLQRNTGNTSWDKSVPAE